MNEASTVYRSHRIIEVLREQGRSVVWFCQQVPCDRSMLYKTRDGERSISDLFVQRAVSVLGVPAPMLFIGAEAVDVA